MRLAVASCLVVTIWSGLSLHGCAGGSDDSAGDDSCTGGPSCSGGEGGISAGGSAAASAGRGGAGGSSGQGGGGSSGEGGAGNESGVTGGAGGSGGGGSSGASGRSGSGGSGGGKGGSAGAGTGGAAGDGDYVVIGSWHGYVFTSVSPGGTITPTDFSARAPDEPFCVSGVVPMGLDSVAILGFNLNQERGVGTPADVMVPAGSGIAVTVTANAYTELRLQIEGPNETTGVNDRWCDNFGAPTNVRQGFEGTQMRDVAYPGFHQACWTVRFDGGFYEDVNTPRRPIHSVAFVVPGYEGVEAGFDFCVDSIAEIP